jgi:hypothetical protein
VDLVKQVKNQIAALRALRQQGVKVQHKKKDSNNIAPPSLTRSFAAVLQKEGISIYQLLLGWRQSNHPNTARAFNEYIAKVTSRPLTYIRINLYMSANVLVVCILSRLPTSIEQLVTMYTSNRPCADASTTSTRDARAKQWPGYTARKPS